jgi:enoyl-CoA hydratase/carnithine racemase
MIKALRDNWTPGPTIRKSSASCCAATAPRLCAGGEVRSLVEAAPIPAKCRRWPQFFAAEYRLDFSLHTYPKPLICWGHGYVLGGGMGLLQGEHASSRQAVAWRCRRSASACTRMSGQLVPVRLPGKLGLFLGLTGAHMNARDAIDLDLADRFLLDEQQEPDRRLVATELAGTDAEQLNSLFKALQQEAVAHLPEAQWLPRRGASMNCWMSVMWVAPGRPSARCAITRT